MLALLLLVAAITALVTGAFSSSNVDGGEPDGGKPGADAGNTPPPPPPEEQAALDYCAGDQPTDWTRILATMPVVRWDGNRNRDLDRMVRRGRIAGVIVFPAVGAETLAAETARLQRLARENDVPPLVVSIDQEGGPVKRFSDAPPETSPRQLADADASASDVRRQGRATGRFLAEAGVNVDFAPVLDMPVSPDSLTYSRSFGDTPELVSRRGLAFAAGLEREGVAATAKHFPGLGRTTINTDLLAASIDVSFTDLAVDLAPFEDAIDAEIPAIMTANATYPALDPDRPASLSRRIITGILRDELRYDGVVVTDDLGAGGITSGFAPQRAAILAAVAGNDWLLYAGTMDPGILPGLRRAVRNDRLDTDQARASCVRSVKLRETLGYGPR